MNEKRLSQPEPQDTPEDAARERHELEDLYCEQVFAISEESNLETNLRMLQNADNELRTLTPAKMHIRIAELQQHLSEQIQKIRIRQTKLEQKRSGVLTDTLRSLLNHPHGQEQLAEIQKKFDPSLQQLNRRIGMLAERLKSLMTPSNIALPEVLTNLFLIQVKLTRISQQQTQQEIEHQRHLTQLDILRKYIDPKTLPKDLRQGEGIRRTQITRQFDELERLWRLRNSEPQTTSIQTSQKP